MLVMGEAVNLLDPVAAAEIRVPSNGQPKRTGAETQCHAHLAENAADV